MEDMRRRFLEGFEQYKKEGFNAYEVPWYLVMGEPGSGKTFAVRQSGIGFLSGMQDERQGTGGTKTMDWWFTKSGVLLDTAGRWSTGSSGGQTLSSQELAQFLRLLKKHRSRCPINGLILVLDGERMQNESEAETREKARLLSEALFQVKRELDVRFPVIIWISKCDTIPGFRSYFESFNDIKQQHQMLGWSNPAANIDEPFRAEQVEDYLSGVVAELRRRRWQQMYDVALPGDARRVDAVDSLFVFPSHLEKLTPAVRLYLEIIFGDMRRAPFLRGIYFNSAITEGAEVDRTIAEAMGLTPQEYRARSRSSNVFRKDRALFIKDTLAEKLFKERNLVTRASNAVAALRRTQIVFVGVLVLCLGAMATMAWFSSKRLREDLGMAAAAWSLAAWQLKPEMLFLNGPGSPAYTGHARDLATNGIKVVPFEVLTSTLADTAKDTRIPPPFGWFLSRKGSSQEDRRAAWSKLYRTHYLEPFTEYLSLQVGAPTNREARIAGVVHFDSTFSAKPPAIPADATGFPLSLMTAVLDPATESEIEANARLLADAGKTNLLSGEWYAKVQENLRDKTADGFDGLLGDKKTVLQDGTRFIESARAQALADQRFVDLEDQFFEGVSRAGQGELTASALRSARDAFNRWRMAKPATRVHANLAGAGDEAAQKLERTFGQSFKALQDQLITAKSNVMAASFLARLDEFRGREMRNLGDGWAKLTNEFRLDAVTQASSRSEQLLPAVGGALELFGSPYGPTAEKPMAGWSALQTARADLHRKNPNFRDELESIIQVAGTYQYGRASAAVAQLAASYQARLARWPLAESSERIPEEEFGVLVKGAKAAMNDPLILGDPAVAAGLTNLNRMVATADLLDSRKKVALQMRLAAKQDSVSFRALFLGDDTTGPARETLNLNDPKAVLWLTPVERFAFRARFTDKGEITGNLFGRWNLLGQIWDPRTGSLRTNGIISLPLQGGETVRVEVLGATWAE